MFWYSPFRRFLLVNCLSVLLKNSIYLSTLNNEEKKLDFKGHPQRIQTPISDQNWFSWFQSWYGTALQKLKSEDQTIPEMYFL